MPRDGTGCGAGGGTIAIANTGRSADVTEANHAHASLMGVEPFRGSEAVARGLLTKGHLRGPRFRRLFPDIYIDATVPITPSVRARAAALFVEGRGAAAGFSAAELLGASCGDRYAPAEIVAPGRVRAHPGLVAHKGPLAHTGIVDGVRATSPLRTAWALGRRLDLVEAVVAVDALAARDRERPTFVALPPGTIVSRDVSAISRRLSPSPGFDPGELLAWKEACPRARGVRRLERIVELADPRAESPPETRLRLLLVLAGLPVPQVQFPLFDGRDFPWARFDLAYPEALLAVEYDSEDHDDALDRARDRRTSALGWHTLRIDAAGLYRTPDHTVRTIRDLRARREHMLRSGGLREGHTNAPST